MTDPWRARHFNDGIKEGYTGEFLPTGERNWRMVKSGGEPIIFRTRNEAAEAAKTKFLLRYEPPIRSTVEVSPDAKHEKMAAKLAAEAEQFLRSSREDVRRTETHYRAGKRQLTVMRGRA